MIPWSHSILLLVALTVFVGAEVVDVEAADPEPAAAEAGKVAPLPNSHAHNDYEHARPLLDALDHGFCSVEADIFLVDGQLLVGHNFLDLKAGRTLQALYLDPLRQRAQANNGHIYRDGPTFTLLIDIKSDAAMTYAALRTVLAEYDDLLSSTKKDKFEQKAVTAIISGARDHAQIAADKHRHAGIDGRLSDLESSLPRDLLPLISDNWQSHFRWRGKGTMPMEERRKLQDIVEKAHQHGRRVRFWATPEEPALWSALLEAKVDLIGTDDLPALRTFLLEQKPRR